MPRIIFKCPYLKGGDRHTAHLKNLIGYIATREGAQRIDPGRTGYAVTKKQRDMVEQILRDFPLSRGMFEYEDYLSKPTRGNASEFITRALEDNLFQIEKRDNYLRYIAQRPRAQHMGAHGLFTGTEENLVLSQVADAVSHHPGNVWLPIISLRREDAARLGYDDAENWRALLSSYALELANAMKIPWEQFRWYAAFHDEGHHPHIHMVCYSENPSAGYLTKAGISKIKGDLMQRIFRQELTELYAGQTMRRELLGQEARDALERVLGRMQAGALENERLEMLMSSLAQRLRFTGGTKKYGYLKAPLKSVVDEIVDELAKDSRVAEAYRLWYELRDEVLRGYKDTLPEHLPLSRQKEFTRIKNIVIEEAVRLGGCSDLFIPEEETAALPEEPAWEDALPDAEPYMEELPEEAEPHIAWSDRYRAARQYLYGAEDAGVEQDFAQALALFTEEAAAGNALAMHDLGRMLVDGLGMDADPEQAQAWYAKALAAFHAVEEEKPDRYAEYRIGKMYAAGLGTPQDDAQAAEWFTLSADQRYQYAQYSLAGLYAKGKGVEQDHKKAFALYTASAMQSFPYAAFELGKLLRDGVGCEKDSVESQRWFSLAFDGFCQLERCGHDDRLHYRLGWMLLRGVGTDTDEDAARRYYEKAARLGNPHAQYQLAKLLLAAPDAQPEDIRRALGWLKKAADTGQDCAQYALGKLYRDGGAVEKDIAKAVSFLRMAAESGNAYAAYALGKLYQEGAELPRDMAEAVRWLRCAAEQNNPFAQYRMGKLLLQGDGVLKDAKEAIRWLTAAAEQENAYAEYALGMIYLKGEDAPQDYPKAADYLRRSAGRGNPYAAYRLGKLLLSGEQVPKDVQEAVRLLTDAAEQGSQFAQYTMGKLCLLGKEIPQDREAAARWFTMAAAQGNEYAQFFLERMNDPWATSCSAGWAARSPTT